MCQEIKSRNATKEHKAFKNVSEFLLNKSHISEYGIGILFHVKVMPFNNSYRVAKLF